MTYQHRSLIDRFYNEDDLIREVWVLSDVYSLIRQLDLMPSPSNTGCQVSAPTRLMTAGLAKAFLELDWGAAIALGIDSIMGYISWRRQEWDQR